MADGQLVVNTQKTLNKIGLNSIHHIAIICADYEKSKHFYVNVLGLEIIKETYRAARESYKLDLSLNGMYVLELFSFSNPPERSSQPEAQGLRHLAFEVKNIETTISHLEENQILVEPIRTDELTGKRFTFFSDPDDLPLELYEK